MKLAGSLILSISLVGFPDAQSNPTERQDSQQKQPKTPEVTSLKQPLAVGLEDGTPIKLRITRNLSSADATTGDRVDFEVLEDVKIKDVIVVPRGGLALATVTQAEHKRRMARGGKLDVNIDDVRLTDGEKAPLRAVKESRGGGHTGAMTGAMVGTAIVFFPAAPLFLFMYGKDITIPKGTEVTAYINGDIPLDLTKFQPQTATRTVGTSVVATAQDTSGNNVTLGSVEVRSTPDGAEITVDEKYVGSTPSTLKLVAGDHKARLERSGFKTWERTLTVGAGATVTLNPTLNRE